MSCGDGAATKENTHQKLSTPEQTIINKIKQFPDSLILKENLIQLYRDSGNYKKALSALDDFIKSDSSNGRFWNMKAILLFENGDTLNSIHAFEKEFEFLSSPTDSLSLATLYAETKNEKANHIADALIKNYSLKYEKEATFIKGLYESYQSNYVKAISFFDKCISIDYTFMEAYREKSICLMNLKKYEDATNTLIKAVTLKNNFDEGYYYLGQCYEKTNQIEKAKDSYQKALLYSPDFTDAKEALDKLK